MDLDEKDECGDTMGIYGYKGDLPKYEDAWSTSAEYSGKQPFELRDLPNAEDKLNRQIGAKYWNVTWNWFTCQKNRKCIHSNSRCDLHPNPECIYENEDGQMVAEDEEGCLEEYKSKGLITKSGNFECQSAIHNSDSPAIKATKVRKLTNCDTTRYCITTWRNVTVINKGTIVKIMATRCDGIPECFNAIDEENCGFSTFENIFTGKPYF